MRLRLDARGRRWLRRLPVVNVYSVAELALMAVLAVQGARLLWVIVTPVSPLGEWRPLAPAIAGSASAILEGFDPFFRLQGQQAAPAAVTTLQLTLFGTRLDEASGRGSAILAGPDGVQRSVSVGEEIQPGVTLKAVAFDHITIDRGGATEDLYLDQSDAPPAAAGASALGAPSVQAPGSVPPAGGVAIAQLRSDIGFIPRLDGGRVSGLVVRSQGSGAAFRAAGLREGDIVTALGGRPVTGPGDLDRLAADFAQGGSLSITVERGDQTLPLSLQIAAPRP
ncbi:type II secretion system protein N [Sphingomonas parapaucimobilis]|uniref:General secretion pathway protein C n=1 Tax=Sphingomonas parapaucimobilis NBRC 15100 TaxID=1219049 RepID=A0A0A1W5H0_9SPHN|nr:type II secretion system protein N [Sphingomonas parapaucimobilis]GAM00675.1 general secretion pathway protein C [Sphingomonas parapaucimobilis NBRC 15100]